MTPAVSADDLPEVVLALDNGYAPNDIARSTIPTLRIWGGEESKMWSDWIEQFEILRSNQDERLRKAGELGVEHAEGMRDQALKRENDEDVTGRMW